MSPTRLPLLSCTLLSLALLASTPAWAVYKCEADGQVTYSDSACTDGKTVTLHDNQGDVSGVRDQAESKRVQRERTKAAQQQTQARHKAEREAARAKLVEEKQKRKCTQLAQRKKWAEEDLRTANTKNQEKLRRKSQRANDQYQAECAA